MKNCPVGPLREAAVLLIGGYGALSDVALSNASGVLLIRARSYITSLWYDGVINAQPDGSYVAGPKWDEFAGPALHQIKLKSFIYGDKELVAKIVKAERGKMPIKPLAQMAGITPTHWWYVENKRRSASVAVVKSMFAAIRKTKGTSWTTF